MSSRDCRRNSLLKIRSQIQRQIRQITSQASRRRRCAIVMRRKQRVSVARETHTYRQNMTEARQAHRNTIDREHRRKFVQKDLRDDDNENLESSDCGSAPRNSPSDSRPSRPSRSSRPSLLVFSRRARLIIASRRCDRDSAWKIS